jgi:hypothetical protein
MRILRNKLDPSGKTVECWHHGKDRLGERPCADKPDGIGPATVLGSPYFLLMLRIQDIARRALQG